MRKLFQVYVAAVILGHVIEARTHAQPAAPLPPSHVIQPTVTAAMAGAGGKFFGRSPDPARTRHYYIAAEPQVWDYAPRGCQVMCSDPLPLVLQGNHRGAKLRYMQYTDATFEARVLETPRLGLLGPVLRGVVGEYLAVTFLNRTPRPLSMHPHGLKYDKDSEGSDLRQRHAPESMGGSSTTAGTGAALRHQRLHLRQPDRKSVV